MRRVLLIALLLSSCSRPKDEAVPVGAYGNGRDALCVSGSAGAQRAGLIAYGPGDKNCSAVGSLTRFGDALILTPSGDSTCKITIVFKGETISIGSTTAGCAYYCGPGAAMGGRHFSMIHEQGSYPPAHDLAGDPLC